MQQARASAHASRPSATGLDSFSDAAKRSGVEALAPSPGRVRVPPAKKSPPVRAQPGFVVREEEGSLTGYRRDEGKVSLGRVRGLPRAKLDLHGLRLEVARRRLSAFLGAERQRGEALVLVVVGKGRHSPRGDGVLRRGIGELLTTDESARHVQAFATAPALLGGDGAVLVLLVPRHR